VLASPSRWVGDSAPARAPGLPSAALGRRAVTALPRSNAEESLATLIRWEKIREPIREFRFAPPRRWRFDFSWPERFVAVEVDGGSFIAGRHTRGEGFERDLEKLNTAALIGWRVLRVTPRMIEDGRAIELIRRALND
jgi:very-short-patch-repair endonuclease